MSLEEEIARTQEILQPLIERPQLKEKFLTKPPFRFLHDIVTSLIRSTGFPQGLYVGDELDSGNFKDKEAKLGFLSKLIRCVGICLGRPIDVREGKIVAGLEPEKTNRLLQCLAQAAKDDSIDRNEAIRKALAGDEPSEVPRTKEEFSKPPPIQADFGSRRPSVEDDADEKPQRAPPSARPTASRGGQRSASRRGSRDDTKAAEDGDEQKETERQKASEAGVVVAPDAGRLDAHIEACDGSIEHTRLLLEPLLVNKKPKLSDKLLNKPPFRFLHDLIMEVMRSTGFGRGLYDNSPLSDSSNVVDKDSKITFLNMIIKLVGTQLNTVVEARPQKIVSGLEAENTNRFLQLLAVAAIHLPDSSSNVKYVLESLFADRDQDPQPDEAGRDAPRSTDPSSDSRSAEVRRPSIDDETDVPDVAAAKDDEPPRTMMMSSSSGGAADSKNTTDYSKIGLSPEDFAEQEVKRSTRPVTAHRRPPKFKEKGDDEAKESKEQVVDNKTKIIVDGTEDEDDEDDELDLHENDAAIAEALKAEAKTKLAKEIQEEELDRLAKKKAQKQQETKSSDGDGGGGIRFGKIDKAAAKKHKDFAAAAETDVPGLQLAVQELCRSTNPLGKCMDYVREDLSAMNRELEKWRDDYREQLCAMDEEEKASRDELKPLRAKLVELDELIELEREQTRKVKNRITKQEERINFLLNATCTMSF